MRHETWRELALFWMYAFLCFDGKRPNWMPYWIHGALTETIWEIARSIDVEWR